MNEKKRILVLDDEAIVCERLAPALEKAGFDVVTCTDSQTAIDKLRQERFDVLVTDVKMRGPDGIEVMDVAHEQSPTTKVIVITGFATAETARSAMKSGAVDFIAKPFKISQLRDLILSITKDPE
jgi:DNA-binding NtrC family response regulator